MEATFRRMPGCRAGAVHTAVYVSWDLTARNMSRERRSTGLSSSSNASKSSAMVDCRGLRSTSITVESRPESSSEASFNALMKACAISSSHSLGSGGAPAFLKSPNSGSLSSPISLS